MKAQKTKEPRKLAMKGKKSKLQCLFVALWFVANYFFFCFRFFFSRFFFLLRQTWCAYTRQMAPAHSINHSHPIWGCSLAALLCQFAARIVGWMRGCLKIAEGSTQTPVLVQ